MKRTRSFAGLLGLALAASLAVYSCGGGGGGGSSPTAPPPAGNPQVVTVQVRDFNYEPSTVTVQPGDTVRWVFSGSDTNHTVTARNGAFNSGAVFTSQGATFERQFGSRGTFEYSCQAHSECCRMRGSVRVGSDAPPPSPGYE
ncbi:MAG TPA: plastocyanin/azurin family copper-binding protein [Thermoanaerobaculia bacterium]